MPITAPVGSTKDFDPVPSGSHLAYCYQVVVLPHQETQWGVKDRIAIGFCLPEERMEFTKEGEPEEGPRVLTGLYNLSMNPKAKMRHFLEGWRGKAFTDAEAETFDVEKMLGKWARISVIHNESGGQVYANVDSAARVSGRDAEACKELPQEIEPFSYDGSGDYDHLPEWLQKKVAEGLEAKGKPAPDPATPPDLSAPAGDDDDIPF